MQNFMRQHKKLIMWFIILIIGVPMAIFFGLPQGGGSRDAAMGENIMEIGGVPVTEADFRQSLSAASNRGNQSLTYDELYANGTVDRILEQLIDSALLKVQEEERGFYVSDRILQDEMKKWSQFQSEDGTFDPKRWNQWVREYDAQGRNWDELYGDLRKNVGRQVMLNVIEAKANRISDDAIWDEVEDDFTNIVVKYAKISPEVTLTREQVEAHYEENRENYRELDEKRAQFAVIPYVADVPELATELVEKARAGEDFAALADEYSAFETKNGGEMGWVDPETAGALRKAALELQVGEVSDPVPSKTGYYIYKVDDERFVDADGNVIGEEAESSETADAETAEGDEAAVETPETTPAPAPESGTRQVLARQIFIEAALDEAGLQAKADLGEEVANRAAELHEIAKEVQALTIEGVNWGTQATELAGRAAELAALAEAQAAAGGDDADAFTTVQTAASDLEANVDTTGQPAPLGEQAAALKELAEQAATLLSDEELVVQAEVIARWADIRTRAATYLAAREQGDESPVDLSGLREAVAEFGLELYVTDNYFDNESAEIDHVAPLDVLEVRQALSGTDDSVAPYNVIRAVENVYVASVIEVVPGEVPPLDEIYAEVEADALQQFKGGLEYRDQVAGVVEEIKAAGVDLEQIGNQFPTLQDYQVKTSEPANRSEGFFLSQEDYLMTRSVFDLVGHAEPGTVDGPVRAAIGGEYFVVELVSATPPTAEELAEKEEQFEMKKNQQITRRQTQLLMDYLANLRENLLPTVPQEINEVAINRILGRSTSAPVETAAEEDAPNTSLAG